jgi:hypothetical protein
VTWGRNATLWNPDALEPAGGVCCASSEKASNDVSREGAPSPGAPTDWPAKDGGEVLDADDVEGSY